MREERARTPRVMAPAVTKLQDGVSHGALVPPPRVPTKSEVIVPSQLAVQPAASPSSATTQASDVMDLAAVDQWLADRSRRREQLLHELETARARRRRRGGLRAG